MPSELGGGEGEEPVEDKADDLEELREEIREEHQESGDEGVEERSSEHHEEVQSLDQSSPNPQNTSEGGLEDTELSESGPEDEPKGEDVGESKLDEGGAESKEEPSDEPLEPAAAESQPAGSEDPTPSGAENESELEALDDIEAVPDSARGDVQNTEEADEGKESAGLADSAEVGERDEQLEELRERIEEQYGGPTDQDEDRSLVTEDEVGGDGTSLQDRQLADESPDSLPSKGTSEEIDGTEQESAEREPEPPDSEGTEARIEDFEELRAEIIERSEEAGADVVSLDARAGPDQDDGSETPPPESLHEDGVRESSFEEGSLAPRDHQEQPDSIEEGKAAPMEPPIEPQTNEQSGLEEEQGKEEVDAFEINRSLDLGTADSEHSATRDPLAAEATSKVEGFEEDEIRSGVFPEEHLNELPSGEIGPDTGGLTEQTPVPETGPSEMLEAEHGFDTAELKSAAVETWPERRPAEPVTDASLHGVKETDEREVGTESLSGADQSPKPAEDPTLVLVNLGDSNTVSISDSPSRAEERTLEQASGSTELGQLQRHPSFSAEELGVDSRVSTIAPGETADLVLAELNCGDGYEVRGGASDAKGVRRAEPQEGSRQGIDQKLAPTEGTSEVNVVVKADDIGANPRETTKLSSSGMDSAVTLIDSDQRINATKEQLEPKSAARQGISDSPDTSVGTADTPSKSADSVKGREPTQGESVSDTRKLEWAKASESRNLTDSGPVNSSSDRPGTERAQPSPIEPIEPRSVVSPKIALTISDGEPNASSNEVQKLQDNSGEKTELKTAERLLLSTRLESESGMVLSEVEPKRLAVAWESKGAPEDNLAVFYAKPYFRSDSPDSARFDVFISSAVRDGRFSFEKGQVYDISGEIQGNYRFTTRYLASDGRYPKISITVPRETLTESKSREAYRIQVDRIELARSLSVGRQSDQPVIRIHERILEAWGLKRDGLADKKSVVEFVIRIGDSEHHTRRMFAQYDQVSDRMHVMVSGLGLKKGDSVEFLSANKYTIDGFLKDFGSKKPNSFEGVRLLRDRDSLALALDDTRILIENPELHAYRSRAVLEGVFESTRRPVRFEFDGNRITSRIDDAYTIDKISSTKYGISISSSYGRHARQLFEPTHYEREATGSRERVIPPAWTWRDVAAWFDTEGSLGVYSYAHHRKYTLEITQKERAPLDGIVAFLSEQGTKCGVIRDRKGVHYVRLQTLEGIATVIRETRPYVRTERKREQIQSFEDALMTEPKTRNRYRLSARAILQL